MTSDALRPLHSVALAVAAVLSIPAQAADSPPVDEELSEVIITGTARAERRFDASYAVNSLSQDEVLKLAPLSYADMLSNVPGVFVESTGGEVQNITRLRGIPTDRGYIVFMQDGLPLWHELDGVFFNSGEGMHRFDLMTERVEVVRGGPAPIYSTGAGIANNITVTGGDVTRGKAQLTLGDTGMYRAEAVQSGPVSDRTYYAVGGFLRHHDGYRDNGFPNDRGGQFRANLKHDLDNGWIKASINHVDDRNVFYLPIPVADPRNPAVSLDPYLDYFTGTMNSPAFRNVAIKYRDQAGVLQSLERDLADGRHLRFTNIGLQYETQFEGWLASLKAGLTWGKLSFDALYSTTNPVDAAGFAAGSNLTAARAAFGPGVARLGYALSGTNGLTAYDPAADSGLVMQAQYRVIESQFHGTQVDFSLTRKLEGGIGTHDLKLGVYGSLYDADQFSAFNDYLLEVAGQPRTLDLVAYSASGAVLGYVTDKGVLRYTTTLNDSASDAKTIAVYANDTWDITDQLSLDAGIRYEKYDYRGFGTNTAAVNLGDATTLADNATRAFTTQVDNRFEPSTTNWTVGANYDFTGSFGVYARAAHLEIAPQSGVVRSTAPNLVGNKADQYEVGIKATFGRSYLYVTGFYTQFDPLNVSFVAFNPETGRNDQVLPFFGKAVSRGVEVNGLWRPTGWFSLAGGVTAYDPHYGSLYNESGADPGAVSGNQIVREPKLHGNVRPTFTFRHGESRIELYGTYAFVGKRYVDLFNQTEMPAYQTIGAGIAVVRGAWRAQVVGNNLGNEKGLTEGNTRSDILAGQGTSEAIYGRPLFGRNFRLMLSRSW